ncbi:MAG TPA: TRAP transporter permease [Spirochaetia bacterium]|nr:TRAP transporter permease [Spirochaetia bacterium]
MSDTVEHKESRADRRAREMLREDLGQVRMSRKIDQTLIAVVALGWAFFQLSLPRLVILDSLTIRSVHLAFAVALTFLSFPMFKSRDKDIRGIHSTERIPALDFVLAIVGVISVLYIVLNWEGIAARAGRPAPLDIVMGLATILVTFETARRGIGLPMVILALVFTLYAFLGPYLPGFLAYRGVSVTKYMSQIVLSAEGIYGIPLDVSATTVYLFVLFGALLERLGAGKFFNDLAISLLGRYVGGPAKASVVSSGLTGLVSGSSIANVVTTGTFTIPLMKKVGYPGKTAAATEVAASTNGQLMPPIMGAAAFIIAEYLAISYFEVIRAAFLPAFISYIALFYITHLEATKLGMKGLEAEDTPNFWDVLKGGYFHLLPLFWLIYELAIRRVSPNLAVFNAIILLTAILAIRQIATAVKRKESVGKWLWAGAKDMGIGMISGSRNMVTVALATATAGIIVGIVNMGIGSMIVQVVEVLSLGNVFLLLFITAIVSLIIGMGLPTTATYIVMASITVPVIVQLGGGMGLIIPAIAAHLFCFYFGILADDTPPVGLAAYAAAAIAGSDPIATGIKGFIYDLRTAVIPFMFVFNAELLLVGVNNGWQILLIYATSILGVLAFTNVVQGWFLVRLRWFEIAMLLVVSVVFFLPGRTAELLGFDAAYRYLFFVPAALVYVGMFVWQRARRTAGKGAPRVKLGRA